MNELAKRISQQYADYFRQYQTQMAADGISPTILYIGCVDSRLAPEQIMQVAPGEMFVLRVPGGIVPPQGLGDVCVSGAIELILSVETIRHVVVCAHTSCAFLGKVAEGVDAFSMSNLSRLVSMVDFARAQASTKADRQNDFDGFQQALLEAFVQRNLQALRELRVVKEKEAAGAIMLHSWYFDLEKGQIVVYDETSKTFEVLGEITTQSAPPSAPPQQPTLISEPSPSISSTPGGTQPNPLPRQTPPATASRSVAPKKPAIPQVGTQPPRPTAPTTTSRLAVPKKPAVASPTSPQTSSESIAPPPVKVPSAAPVQRVYAEEVATAAEVSQEKPPPPEPSPRERLKGELRDMMAGIQMPAQRLRLRRMLNQMNSPQQWQLVQEVVQEANDPQLGHSLRQLSIELSRSESRRQLRQIISSVEATQAPTGDWQQIQQEFLDVLNGLVQRKG